jgi:hypothetical protein
VLDLALGEGEGISLLRLIAASPADPMAIVISRLDSRVRAASIQFAIAPGLRVAGALRKPAGPTELHALLEQSPSLRPRLPDIYAIGPTPEELGKPSINIGSLRRFNRKST